MCNVPKEVQGDSTVTKYREITIGKTLYCVTSVFLGEKDFTKTLEDLAVRKAMTDIKAGAKV